MSIWNKILICLILLASLAMWYLGMRALATHRAWRTAAKRLQSELAQLEAERERLIHGDGTTKGIRQLQVELAKYTSQRGRVWNGCRPVRVDVRQDPQAGLVVQVSVIVDRLGLAGLQEVQELPVDSLVYLFDERDIQQGGIYLGAFRVAAVTPRQQDQPAMVQLESVFHLTNREVRRIQSAMQAAQQGGMGWTICELLPKDDHEIFAGLDPETLAQMLPKKVVDEYIRDGKPSDPNNPNSPPFFRKLRDYESAIRYLHLKRSELMDQVAARTADKGRLEAAVADSQREAKARDQEVAQLQEVLKRAEFERDLAVNHLKAVEDTLARVTVARDALIQQNRVTAAEIAQAQEKARQLIEQRVRSVAQSEQPASSVTAEGTRR
ncbi:MAG TPA: hypothetical protein PL064_01010 [Thermogutta sp.]|nr:hypothetical protein [Thermogutta sp.]HQF13222.1 hypothetical protein [Thermogutta sp.]